PHRYLASFPTRRSSDLVPHSISSGDPEYPPEKSHLGRLHPRSRSFGQNPRFLTIGERRLEQRVIHCQLGRLTQPGVPDHRLPKRSEEHTSELQSRFDLV